MRSVQLLEATKESGSRGVVRIQALFAKDTIHLKVIKSRKHFMVSSILPKTNENHYPKHYREKLNIVSFGRIEITTLQMFPPIKSFGKPSVAQGTQIIFSGITA